MASLSDLSKSLHDYYVQRYLKFMSERHLLNILYSTLLTFDYNWDEYNFSIQTPNLQYRTSEHGTWSGQNPVFTFSYWTAEFKGRFSAAVAEKIDRAIQWAKTSGLGFYISHPRYTGFQGELKNDFKNAPYAYLIAKWASSSSFIIFTNNKYSQNKATENLFFKPGDFVNVMGELKQVVHSQSFPLADKQAILVSFIPNIRVRDPRVLRFTRGPYADLVGWFRTRELERKDKDDFYEYLHRQHYCIPEVTETSVVSTVFKYHANENIYDELLEIGKNKKRHVFSVPFALNNDKPNEVVYDGQGYARVHLNLQETI